MRLPTSCADLAAVAAVATLLLATPGAADAQVRYDRGQNVAPVYEGWEQNPDGTYTMVFGYMNRNYQEMSHVPVGPDNRFEPGPEDRGQPTRFTSASGLLEASRALRAEGNVPDNGDGFTVLGAQNHNVGAGFVSKNLSWWSSCADIAVLTPVRPSRSAFVRDLIARVEARPISNPPVGPHRIPWEESQEEECDKFIEELELPDDPNAEVCFDVLSFRDVGGPRQGLRRWLERQTRVAGRTTFTADEIRCEARRIHQRSRAYRRVRGGGVRVMTIHQAKNREFHSVIVLWPYEVAGTIERQRRLLYNAITRARCRVLVVVQNPDRLRRPPFMAGS